MLKPIRSKKQHREYLGRAYELIQLNLKAKSAGSDELEMLTILIEKYEKETINASDYNK